MDTGRPGDAPTRVAVFASSFHPHRGGVEEAVRRLAVAQTRAGLRPTVFTMRWPKSLAAREIFEGLTVRRSVFRSPELPPRRLAAALAVGPFTLAHLVATIRTRRDQLVHIQCVSPASWYAVQAARILHLPLVVTLHGELTMDATGLYQRSGWARHTLRLALRRADAITACSAHTLDEAERWYGRDFGPRARVLHNGVVADEFEQATPHRERRPYVFAIGRLVSQKGFDVLVDGFARLCRSPDFDHCLLVAGDGPERAALEGRARDLGIADRVSFLGATNRPFTASLFRGAAVFVLPSRHEPFGIVVLEALAAGTPVVATDVGGVTEFLPVGPYARLAEPDDAASLAAAIRAITNLGPGPVPLTGDLIATHAWPVIERHYAQTYSAAVAHHRATTGRPIARSAP